MSVPVGPVAVPGGAASVLVLTGRTGEQARSAARDALVSRGFVAMETSATTLSATRTSTVRWRVVTAWVLALPTLGLSLLLLLRRVREEVTVTVSQTGSGARLDVLGAGGQTVAELAHQLGASVLQPPAYPPPPPAYPPPPPVDPQPPAAGVWPSTDWDLAPQPGEPRGEATALRPSAEQATRLVLDTGETIVASTFGLLGRDPQPRSGEPAAQLVPVPDPGQSLSKTHLAFGRDERGLWVADRGSTNGTWVQRPDGGRTDCPAEERRYLDPGAVVHAGDRSLTVAGPH